MSMAVAAVGGTAIAAGGSVAGALISANARKGAPGYNTKGAKGDVKKYLKNVDSIAAGITSPKVDWVGAAGRALGFNEQQLSRFEAMADLLSKSGTDTLLDQLDTADPEFFAKRDLANKNNLALMRGEVPIDVQQQLARSAAFSGVSSGTGGGSGINRNLRARDLGLTSLNLMQIGDQSAQRWTALVSDVAVSPAFVSPFQTMQFSGISSGQAIQSAFRQADLDMQAQLASAGIRADAQGTALGANLGIAGQQYRGDLNQYAARASSGDTWANSISNAAGTVGGTIAGLATFDGGTNISGPSQYAFGTVPSAAYSGTGASPFSFDLWQQQTQMNPKYGWMNIGSFQGF